MYITNIPTSTSLPAYTKHKRARARFLSPSLSRARAHTQTRTERRERARERKEGWRGREAYPALHVQAAAEDEAEGELEFAGQSWQDVSDALNLPALHAAQVSPAPVLLPVKPSLQVHAARRVLPAGDLVPAGHVLQAAGPVDSL